jgi:hypothetical protein
MGFTYNVNRYTGRETLACDFCGNSPARKIKCPYNYCQAWATCPDCRTAGKHKVNSAGQYGADGVAVAHSEYCKTAHQKHEEQQREREENKDRVTVAAYGSWCTGQTGIVLVMTASEDYYLVTSEHYNKRDVSANNFIDENYNSIESKQAKALIAAAYA